MTTACFIPIKARSERCPGKNLRPFRGRPLFHWIIDHAIESEAFDRIYVDTDSPEVWSYVDTLIGVTPIHRKLELAQDNANGNDLLVYHAESLPGFDLYFQLFATAPALRPGSIRAAAEIFEKYPAFDSVLSAIPAHGWFWFRDQPINYRPGILPRSQDAFPVWRETTGLYGIQRSSLIRHHCRIGHRPYFLEVSPEEAVDVDTESDFGHIHRKIPAGAMD